MLRRKKPKCTSLAVSFPLKYYLSQPTLSIGTLSSLPPQSLPESWTVAAKHPLTIVKLRILNTTGVPRVDVVITVSVQDDLTWGLSVQNNPSVHESTKNTQTLRVINSFRKGPVSGNCRGNRSTPSHAADKKNIHEPPPKRRRTRRK